MNNENKTTTLEQWLEQTTSVKIGNYKIAKLAKNQDVIIYSIIDPNSSNDTLGSFVYFYKSKKIQECETFEGAMHLYFY